MKHRISNFLFVSLAVGSLLSAPSCSTEKTGWAHRTYHNVTSRFNGYFNAKELLRLQMKQLKEEPEDFSKMLPVFRYPTEEQLQNVTGDMDKAIEKCKRVISKHSIEKRGDQYVKWIDDTYFVMGKAHFMKHEYPLAKEMFKYVSRKFKAEEIHYDALLWLAKTYIAEDNYTRAERILRLAEGEPAFPDRLDRNLHLTYADMYIQQENYDLAISDMQRAITLTKRRKEKARLYFILAQVYQEKGDRTLASTSFAKVIALNPNYDMMFYARINRALSFSQDYGKKEEIRKQLLAMLKDDKNIEFRDQIYYALAELEAADENEEQAIDYYRLSTEASVNNDPQKGLSFLKLGDIFFARPEYNYAQTYYDSAVTFLESTHERYSDLVKLSNNLNELINNLQTIEHQDSLQRVAQMPEKERLALIDDLIYQRKIEEEEKQLAMEAEMNANNNPSGSGGAGGGRGPGVGMPGSGNSKPSWYFYNPTVKGFGASEFKKTWGSRKNEDDWRRSNKAQVASAAETPEDGGKDYYIDENGDTVRVTNDWQDPGYYLKDLPLTEEALERSDSLIVEAYYRIGILYKENLQDDPKSIETFEELNKRFPDHRHLLEVYYRLYRMHSDLKHYTESDRYKKLILDNYPNSDYAKIIIDPDALKRDNKLEKEAREFYTSVYETYYKRGFYTVAAREAEKGITLYAGTEVENKLRFIRAMSIGKDQGEAAMRQELKSLAEQLKGDPIAKKAEEVLAALDSVKALEQQRQEEKEKEKEKGPYTYDPNSAHNYLVLLPIQKLSSNNAQIAISNFNRANYNSNDLSVSSVLWSNDTALLTIKDFKTAQQAKSYEKGFVNNKLKLAQIHASGAQSFPISFNNYATFYQRKNIQEYLRFYNKHYKE